MGYSDNLPVSMLKPVIDSILKPLEYLINLSIESDEVKTKITPVHPIYKSGNRSEMTNHQPISIYGLPITAKVLEKVCIQLG